MRFCVVGANKVTFGGGRLRQQKCPSSMAGDVFVKALCPRSEALKYRSLVHAVGTPQSGGSRNRSYCSEEVR